MSAATSSTSWRSTRARRRRSWIVEVRWRGSAATSAWPRRPSTIASGPGSGPRPTGCSTAVAARRRALPRLPLRFDLVVVEPGERVRQRHAM